MFLCLLISLCTALLVFTVLNFGLRLFFLLHVWVLLFDAFSELIERAGVFAFALLLQVKVCALRRHTAVEQGVELTDQIVHLVDSVLHLLLVTQAPILLVVLHFSLVVLFENLLNNAAALFSILLIQQLHRVFRMHALF